MIIFSKSKRITHYWGDITIFSFVKLNLTQSPGGAL